jgi:hypothetical protein
LRRASPRPIVSAVRVLVLGGGCLALALAATSVVSAGTPAAKPFTRLLATAQGRGAVTISAPTTHLRGRVWLYRTGGAGTARGKASVSCRSKTTAAGSGGTVTWFAFQIEPNARREVWRYVSDACTIDVTLQGAGRLTVALRGY